MINPGQFQLTKITCYPITTGGQSQRFSRSALTPAYWESIVGGVAIPAIEVPYTDFNTGKAPANLCMLGI